ncbi:DUF732 domain-containing protein [Actinoplanes sp. NPDC024001]|uniref:DUF732 domain-containing protein n=1 Tax=Actinoplanes sp. NPDC024001 TaxID=3154598 RepID=UPI0034014666
MRRLGLFVTAAAVPMIAACGAPAGVPEWKDGQPRAAAPSATGSLAAPAPSEPAAAVSAPAEDRPAATAAPSPAAPNAAESQTSAPSGESFIAAVRGQLPEVAVDRRPEEITEMGDAACAAMAGGQRRAAAASEITEYGVTAGDARELVVLARSFLCRT